LDDFFRFVSFDSHFRSSVLLIIRVDQLIGGGSVEINDESHSRSHANNQNLLKPQVYHYALI
ncbi:hypothetical protein BOW28_05615, partial [Solemya velum gill symbiont]